MIAPLRVLCMSERDSRLFHVNQLSQLCSKFRAFFFLSQPHKSGEDDINEIKFDYHEE